MESRQPKTQLNYLYGQIVRTPYDCGTLKEVILPQLDEETYVIAAPDIPGENRIEIYGTEVPVFADSVISYKGQAVLAMFSEDKTDLELKADCVQVFREETSDIDLNSGVFHTARFHRQTEKPVVPEDSVTVESSFELERVAKTGTDVLSVRVYREADVIVVDAPTKWSAILRRTVSDVLGIPVKNVSHFPTINRSSMDVNLFEPIIVASIAAVAVVKTGRPVRMDFKCDAFTNKVKVDRKTVLTSDGIPIQENIAVKVDQGAFPVFAKEVCNQVLAGIVPPYSLQCLDVEVSSVSSNTYPTVFFGGMGFIEAMHASNRHFSRIAQRFGISPVEWWFNTLGNLSGDKKVIAQKDSPELLGKMIEKVASVSDFRHKDSVYRMQSRIPLAERQDMGYSRGVGLACGPAVNGFSNEMKTNYKLSLTLRSDDVMVLNIGLPQDKNSSILWKKIIADEMDLDLKNILLVPPDDYSINDSGPDCLSRDTGIIPEYLKEGCRRIKERRFNDPLPITIDIPLVRTQEENSSMFITRSWCVVAAEIELDMILFRPMVRHIWVSGDFGQISDERALKERIRHVISGVLSLYGFYCDAGNDGVSRFDIDLIDRNDGYTTSITQLLRSLTLAAISSALEQAMGSGLEDMPVTGGEIFALTLKNESTEVKKEGESAADTDD